MSIVHDVEQGSPDWLDLRIGLPTASEAHRIITPKKRQFSSQARGYAFRLAAETLLHESSQSLQGLEWVERGKALEPQAAMAYSMLTERELKPVGFITTNDKRVGASPDRLIVGENAALELKAPSPAVQLEYLVDGFGDEYLTQAMCQCYVGEFDRVDRYAHHPQMPGVLVPTYRDEDFIKSLRSCLGQFLDMLDEILMKARATGLFQEAVRIITPVDRELSAEELGEFLDSDGGDALGVARLKS